MSSDFTPAYVVSALLVLFAAFVTWSEVKFDVCVREKHSLTACLLDK